jgi:hypothetical protein
MINRFSFARVVLVVGLVAAVSTRACARELVLPAGWRLPTPAEVASEWRNDDPDRYAIVRGDFNGDGIVDQSMLLVSTRKQGYALFAFVSRGSHKFKAYKLDADKSASLLEIMGISKISPGTYRTACGKGYWKCEAGEPAELLTMQDSIEYFREQSAASYFHWDRRRHNFRRTWISD